MRLAPAPLSESTRFLPVVVAIWSWAKGVVVPMPTLPALNTILGEDVLIANHGPVGELVRIVQLLLRFAFDETGALKIFPSTELLYPPNI